MAFGSKIISWYEVHGRKLPWRGIDDPYRIWLSEIILQQTRIEQGMSYYQHFTETYPSIRALADASEEQVLKSWQGLGYYSRARNLHAAAKQIMDQFGGVFPSNYKDILSLKGVGKYTAAAIASFAFRLPYPVIDGNVYRLISRLYNISTPIGTTAAYNEFEQVLLKLIDKKRPDLFNQATMDFGSTYCKPTGCHCDDCIFSNSCMAHLHNKVALLPVKAKAPKVRNRFFYYFDIEWSTPSLDNQQSHFMTLMHQRTGNDIWKGLYEFPLMESETLIPQNILKKKALEFLQQFSEHPPILLEERRSYTHQLTHRTIHASFFHAILKNVKLENGGNEIIFLREQIKKLPMSRLIDRYLSSL